MNYFLDTEFHEYKAFGVNTIELISIGIVAEDGRELYLKSKDFDLAAARANEWLAENVLHQLADEPDTELLHDDEIAQRVLDFVGTDSEPRFYAYYADYDWVVFCWLFGRMVDLPKYFPMYCRDLKQMLDDTTCSNEEWLKEVKEHPLYPGPNNEHNALADARWNRDLYQFLYQYSMSGKKTLQAEAL